MVITYSQSKDQPDKVANAARGQLGIWSRETGSAVPPRVSLLISIIRLNLVHTYEIPPDFRGGIYLFKPPYAIDSVSSLSGHAIRTDGIHCRESAGTGTVNLKV